MKILLPLAALAAGFLVAPTAQAQQVTNPTTTVVHVADLNLDTPAGQAALDRRIDRAARTVCTTDAASFPSARAKAQRCRTATITAVTAQRDMLLAAARQGGGVELSAR